MISICIPIYNHDVRETVGRLSRQVEAMNGGVEIVCIDDGSREEYRLLNREIAGWCRYVELERNVGRSRIRNMFLGEVSKGCEYMIFMDCDLEVRSNDYVERYVEMASGGGAQVVVGGHRYVECNVDRKYRLHYEYGRRCEERSVEVRRGSPNRSFMTGNFMIAKELLERVRFDERIEGYGHEDTLMGYRLWSMGVEMEHIENVLWVKDLDENGVFMDKTEEGVRNLWRIAKWVNSVDFEDGVALLRFYNKLKRIGLLRFVGWICEEMRGWMRKRFEQGWSNMIALKMYKLGLLISEVKKDC